MATATAGVMALSREFLTGGHAVFTVANPAGVRYTFRVSKSHDPDKPPVYFVGWLSGPDNTADYSYLGLLDPQTGAIRLTRKSQAGEDATVTKVARWVVRLILAGAPVPAGYSLHHEGRCGRCGRVLTVPESIERGIGPECWARLN